MGVVTFEGRLLALAVCSAYGCTLSVLSIRELSAHFEARTCFQSLFNTALCKALPPFGFGAGAHVLAGWSSVVRDGGSV